MVDAVFGEMHLRSSGRTGGPSSRTLGLGARGAPAPPLGGRPHGPQAHAGARRRCVTTTRCSGACWRRGSACRAPAPPSRCSTPTSTGSWSRSSACRSSGADLAALGAEILGPEVRAAYPHFTAFAEGRALQPGYAFGDEFESASTSCSGRAAGAGPETARRTLARGPAVDATRSVSRCSGSTPARAVGRGRPRARGAAPAVGSRRRSAARRDGRRGRRCCVVGIDIPIGYRTARCAGRRAGRRGCRDGLGVHHPDATGLPGSGPVRRGCREPRAQRAGRRCPGLRAAREDPRGRHVAARPADRRGGRGAPRGVVRGDDRAALPPKRTEEGRANGLDDARGGRHRPASVLTGSGTPPTTCSTPAPWRGRRTGRATGEGRRGCPTHPRSSRTASRAAIRRVTRTRTDPRGWRVHRRADRVAAMTARVSHTTVDCRDAYALSQWWKGVLDYVRRRRTTRTSRATRSA